MYASLHLGLCFYLTGLIELFREAVLGDLMQLKDKKSGVDIMQEANLDGLAEYINKGQQTDKIQALELEKLLSDNLGIVY